MTSRLPVEFELLQISYNAQREKWKIEELITIHAHEEDRMSRNRDEMAHLTVASPSKKVIATIRISTIIEETIKVHP